jgi:hypothetical protein
MAYKRASPIIVSEGGTGNTSLTTHSVLIGEGTSAITPIVVGTNGQLLIGAAGANPAFATVTSGASTIGFTTGANSLAFDVNSSLQITTGFATWGGAGNYFDDTTLGSFTISRPGTGYINTTPVSWAAPQTITGMTAGNTYYIYIDNTGTIQKTNTRTDALYANNIVLFECLRDSTPVTNIQHTVKDNHPYNFPVNASNYLHDTAGTVIENINNGANITLNGTQGIQINGTDTLNDHGLETTIPDSASAAVVWTKMYTVAGGQWAQQNSTNTFTGFYNNSGTPTALSAGKFGVYTLYVSKDNLTTTTPVYYAVLNTSQYNNLTAAQTAISSGAVSTISNELYQLEFAQLGYIIYQQSTASIVQVTISKSTLRSVVSSAGTNTASLINTVTTNFSDMLSASNTNVQSALDTISAWPSNDAVIRTTNLATGSASKTLIIGSTNTTSSTSIYSGSTGITIATSTNGPISINSGTGTISISNDVAATSVNVGTGGAAKTVVLGSGSGASITTVDCGTAGCNLGATANNHTTTLGTTNGTATTNINAGSGGIGLTGAVTSANAIGITSGNLTLSSGNLSLINTTNTPTGIISWTSGTRIHNYGTSNFFAGETSGNYTLTGNHNTGLGVNTLNALTSGSNNVALGASSLILLTSGNNNLAVGQGMQTLQIGDHNIAVGYGSALFLNGGSYNTIIGTYDHGSGKAYTSTESSNILIRNDGVTGESNVIRIGTMGGGAAQQNQCFVAGITGVAVVGVNVQVNGNGQLGVVVSSKRYKENIQPMESFSSSIMDLRPVTFNFKKHPDIPAWGLIAEEVADIFPELVVYDKEDKPESVKYQDLSVLLLNELQKLRKEIDELKRNKDGNK